jgi:hypothetical protein
MSWGYPSYLQKIAWDRYWAEEAPLLGEMGGLQEGEGSSLLPDIRCHAHKYTHHPIALAYELKESRFFRHLTLDELIKTAYAEGHRRRSDCFGLEAIQVDPIPTRYAIAISCGMSCGACDNLIFEGIASNEGRYEESEKRWRFIDGPLKKMALEQVQLSHFVGACVPSVDYRLPAFCQSCFDATKNISEPYHWKQQDAYALRQLIAIMEKNNDRQNVTQQRRSRRERTCRHPERRTGNGRQAQAGSGAQRRG